MPEEKLKETKVNEDLARLYEQSFRELKEGEIVKGKVVAVTANEALIDVGYKSEGVIPLNEFSDPKTIKVGDEVDVFVESKEDEGGMVVISKLKADRKKGWETIINSCKEGDVDRSGKMLAWDALQTLKASICMINLDGPELVAADRDGDGVLFPSDALEILRDAVGKDIEVNIGTNIIGLGSN